VIQQQKKELELECKKTEELLRKIAKLEQQKGKK
jgi:hypothetical protein